MAGPKKVLHRLIVNNGQADRLSTLLADGGDPNRRWDDLPHLITAVQSGGLREVKALLRAGPKLDIIWQDGVTPLTVAASKGHDIVVEVLLAAGPGCGGPTPKTLCCQRRS